MTASHGGRGASDGPAAIVRADQLTKDYGHVRALDTLSLEIAPGEIFGLLGPNGSGKTTALRLFLGLLRPTSGWAQIAGHDCWTDGVQARRHVAYLPGELRLYENMNGRQLVNFLGRLRGGQPHQELVRLARTFDIDLSRPIAHLSSGMKRKLALLLVLLPRTPVLILDEPTNTLDPTMREQLLEQLRQARTAGQAVVFSSHVLAEVEEVCDRVGILQQGRLVHVQRMRELREVHRIRATLGRPAVPVLDLPDLNIVERRDNALVAECAGALAPFLSWLAEHDAHSVRIEPLGLAPIYRRYHGVSDNGVSDNGAPA